MFKILKSMWMLLPVMTMAVGWNNIVTTSSTIANISTDCGYEYFAEMNLFVNSGGLHVMVADDDGLFYKRFNSSGVLQSSTTISASGQFANIVGDEDNLYIIYFSGSSLYIKKSTNNGGSWSAHDDLSFGGDGCSGIDFALEGSNLHVVYGKSGETYYRRNTGSAWYNYKHVSEVTSGGSPHIALSSNRIHISWRTVPSPYICDESEEYTRDKAGSTWEDEQEVISSDAAAEWIVTDDTKLHMFYYSFLPMIPRLSHLTRDLDGEEYEWSSSNDLGGANLFVSSIEASSFTDDGILHVIGAHYTDVCGVRPIRFI